MSKSLTAEDKRRIDEFNSKFEAGLDALDKAKQLKEGDYLVLYRESSEGNMQLQVNSYGAPIKYVVVYSTKHGIPFIKRCSKKGEPTGQLYSCVGHLETDDYKHGGQKFQFELDPDFADSLILQDKYDPSVLHKSKKDIWNAVTEHNKSYKVNTHDMVNIINFFHSVKVGDMLWISNSSHLLVQNKKSVPREEALKLIKDFPRHRVKGPLVLILTVVDKRGKVMDIAANFFYYKALYKERPRTYKELNI